MATVNVIKKDGSVAKSVDLDDVDFNEALVHQALVAEQASRREGTADTKTRSEVRGGGRKPWKQKGTGRARAGSIRSPLWVGGGVIFGPHPRNYDKKLPKQMRHAALRSALLASPEKLRLVEDFGFVKNAKTVEVAAFLKASGLENANVLMLLDKTASPDAYKAARNLANVELRHPQCLSVSSLLWADVVIATEADFEALQKKYAAKQQSAA